MTSPRLQIDQIEKRLGSHHFRFDLRLESPGIVAVMGPSGAGKSTLFNLVAGFETPDHGRILIDGADVTGLFPGERPLTFIFQDNNLFGHLDVFSNVGLGLSPSLKLTTGDRAEIEAALDRVGLSGFSPRRPQSLSGGERQRVAFARALVRKRPLILLDEPFAALDPELRHDMDALLVQLQQATGALVMIITHDPDEARRIAGTIVTITDARIASVAST